MIKSTILISLCLLLTACFGGGSVPQDKYYRLGADQLSIKSLAPLFTKIAISNFQADAMHRERAILYSDADKPLQLNRYHYHHWHDIPPKMIQAHMIENLRQVGIAKWVVRYGDVSQIDAKIEGRIKHFERVVSASGVDVVVELELKLRVLDKPNQFWQKTYRQVANTADDSVLASVQAMSTALTRVYEAFLGDLQQQVAQH